MRIHQDSLLLRYLKIILINTIFILIASYLYPLRTNKSYEAEGSFLVVVLPAIITYLAINASRNERYFYSFLSFLISSVFIVSLFNVRGILNFLPTATLGILIFLVVKSVSSVSELPKIDSPSLKFAKISVAVLTGWIANGIFLFSIRGQSGEAFFVIPYFYLLITSLTSIISIVWIKETGAGKLWYGFLTIILGIVATVLLILLLSLVS